MRLALPTATEPISPAHHVAVTPPLANKRDPKRDDSARHDSHQEIGDQVAGIHLRPFEKVGRAECSGSIKRASASTRTISRLRRHPHKAPLRPWPVLHSGQTDLRLRRAVEPTHSRGGYRSTARTRLFYLAAARMIRTAARPSRGRRRSL